MLWLSCVFSCSLSIRQRYIENHSSSIKNVSRRIMMMTISERDASSQALWFYAFDLRLLWLSWRCIAWRVNATENQRILKIDNVDIIVIWKDISCFFASDEERWSRLVDNVLSEMQADWIFHLIVAWNIELLEKINVAVRYWCTLRRTG